MKRTTTACLSCFALLIVAAPAAAADRDEEVCKDKKEGAACTEADGDKGTCRPEDDSGKLECKDHDEAAADEDRAACKGKSKGDACTESDGDKGTCQPEKDSGALECEGNGGKRSS